MLAIAVALHFVLDRKHRLHTLPQFVWIQNANYLKFEQIIFLIIENWSYIWAESLN